MCVIGSGVATAFSESVLLVLQHLEVSKKDIGIDFEIRYMFIYTIRIIMPIQILYKRSKSPKRESICITISISFPESIIEVFD